ncbi:hypothetical protein [Sphingobium sp. BS19]|uniref:hypothetical protein n=1 Tax=Sphingobium sp. BS19 TaxID=3018973 RepID=UPI0022EF967C|nr:hypothetical protein [Sphingobium sp. BS19]GLI99155.1 hypothetical protein Sbs19_29730 [Sphingobium sp. BS19]
MSTFVYFLRRKDGNGPIKIGTSWRGGEARAIDITRRNGVEIACIAEWRTPRCANSYEARFHAHFEPHHLGHEWFDPVPELLAIIDHVNAGTFRDDMIIQRGWCVTKAYQTKASIAHWGDLARKSARAA